MSTLERDELVKACGRTPLDELQQPLKDMTGCGTFLEFRRRVLSPHAMIDPDLSLVLIDEVVWTSKTRSLAFKALMRDSTNYSLMATTRKLLYPTAASTGTARHHLMYVSPDEVDAQGQTVRKLRSQGLASVVAQSQEDAWETAGYRDVTLMASAVARETLKFGQIQFQVRRSDFGGRTFWGPQGYDFDPARSVADQGYIRQAFRRMVENGRDDGMFSQETAEALLEQSQQIPPWLIQRVVVMTPDGQRRLLGEAVMDTRDWAARKELSPDAPGYQVGLSRRRKHLEKHPLR